MVSAPLGRMLSAAAALATVIGGLAALGVIGSSGGGGPSVAQAATSTIDAGTARITIAYSAAGPYGAPKVLWTASGAVDFRLNRGLYSYDYSQEFAAHGGQGPTSVHAITDGTLAFYKLARPVAGASWIELDLSKAYTNVGGVNLGPLFAYNQSPTVQLKSLVRAGNLKQIGSEMLNGTATTHYRGVLQLRSVAENAPPELRAELVKTVNAIAAAGIPAQFPIDAWIGPDGLVRQLRMQTGSGASANWIQMDLYDYGVAVNATPPPGNEVRQVSWAKFIQLARYL